MKLPQRKQAGSFATRIRLCRSEGASIREICTHNLDGIPVRIFDLEKTVADCFKFRHKIGLDVALEA